MRSVLLIALILMAASCSNGAGDEADQLSEILEPTTTLATTSTSATSTVTSTTAAATTSTITATTTTVVDSSETTIDDSTEVLGDGDTGADSLEELPLTGGELTVALVATVALLLGAWLILRAKTAQTIRDRIQSNLSRR